MWSPYTAAPVVVSLSCCSYGDVHQDATRFVRRASRRCRFPGTSGTRTAADGWPNDAELGARPPAVAFTRPGAVSDAPRAGAAEEASWRADRRDGSARRFARAVPDRRRVRLTWTAARPRGSPPAGARGFAAAAQRARRARAPRPRSSFASGFLLPLPTPTNGSRHGSVATTDNARCPLEPGISHQNLWD